MKFLLIFLNAIYTLNRIIKKNKRNERMFKQKPVVFVRDIILKSN